MDLALSLKDVRFSYGKGEEKVEALKGLNLSANYGRITGVLGPNGSGKSTSFKIVSTQLMPQQGEVLLAGVNVSKEPAQARSLLGVTFQSPSLDAQLTVKENLEIHAALVGASNSAVEEKIKRLSLTDKANSKVKELSGGLARRAELAKTLLSSPKVLLLDEPTTGLDPLARQEFWKLLRECVREDSAIVVTTHLMEEAELCDDLVFISKGRVAAQAPLQELKESLGSQVLHLKSDKVSELRTKLAKSLKSEDKIVEQNGSLRVEAKDVSELWPIVQAELGSLIQSIEWSQGSLADVYFQKTGEELDAQ